MKKSILSVVAAVALCSSLLAATERTTLAHELLVNRLNDGSVQLQGWPTLMMRCVIEEYQKRGTPLHLLIDYVNMNYVLEDGVFPVIKGVTQTPAGIKAGVLSLGLRYYHSILPQDFLTMTDLEKLSIESAALEEFPGSLAVFSKLKELTLLGGAPLKRFPEGIDQLSQLEMLWLDLSGAPLVTALPSTLTNLKKLRGLIISGKQIQKLPVAFAAGQLVELMLGIPNQMGFLQFTAFPVSSLPLDTFAVGSLSTYLPQLETVRWDMDVALLPADVQESIKQVLKAQGVTEPMPFITAVVTRATPVQGKSPAVQAADKAPAH